MLRSSGTVRASADSTSAGHSTRGSRSANSARGGAGAEQVTTEDPYDDRVECPHCCRKFNEDVAERHVPRCAEATDKADLKAGGKARPAKKILKKGGGISASQVGAGASAVRHNDQRR